MGFCINCAKCKRLYDTKYFIEFCPWCYADYDRLLAEADALREAIDHDCPEEIERWDNFRKGLK